MIIIGRTRRAIPLGIKLEECDSCQTIGPHAVARRVRWFEILSLPLVRLGADHALICGSCGQQTPISADAVKSGLETGAMEIDRPRPLVSADLLRRSTPSSGEADASPTWAGGQRRRRSRHWRCSGEANASPTWSVLTEDPTVARSTYDHRLREVVRILGPNREAVYGQIWPALALIVVAGVLLLGGSEAMRAAGVSLTAPSPTQDTANVPATPTASPTSKPTATPMEGVFADNFASWLGDYRASILPCYSGGTCDLEAKIEYDDGSSGLLSAEVAREAGLFRDYDSIQLGTTSSCRQEHGSMFALLASMAAETSVIKALKSGEVMPESWRPTLGVEFEPCTSALPDSKQGPAALRTLLADARNQLALAKKAIRAKDWSGARAVSGPLTELATQIARASARDFPAGDGATWAPIRTVGWDLVRLSGLVEIKRLASARSTAKLIDASISAIDGVKLGN